MNPSGSQSLPHDTPASASRWRSVASFAAVFLAVPLCALIFTALQQRFSWSFSDSTFLLCAFGIPLAIYHTLARWYLFVSVRGAGRHIGQVLASVVLAALTLWVTFLLLVVSFGFGAGI